MQRDIATIGAVGGVAVVAVGAVAWFLPTQTIEKRSAPPPAAPIAAPASPPASPAPVAATPAPTPPASQINPDDERFTREIESLKRQHKVLQESFNTSRNMGDVGGMKDILAEMKALPSWNCLEAEQQRGAPFYPALATCRSATAER
ncbi:hypothetical protein [Cyanobium sp. Lug-B]|uniref:hypothetical protein n=1 Tax=Cyanobium sp. Lug-B TaxID=2823716 RepID=UPI0020CB7618|nr:hypothetical protein [Cyanobium sp. Lug-B]MCP9796099.1 hypothetical protein [Cyanobium sp. Lug-B]